MCLKKPQWNLYKVDTIGAWQKCLLYGDDFLSPDLLEEPNDGKIKKNAKFFSF